MSRVSSGDQRYKNPYMIAGNWLSDDYDYTKTKWLAMVDGKVYFVDKYTKAAKEYFEKNVVEPAMKEYQKTILGQI